MLVLCKKVLKSEFCNNKGTAEVVVGIILLEQVPVFKNCLFILYKLGIF